MKVERGLKVWLLTGQGQPSWIFATWPDAVDGAQGGAGKGLSRCAPDCASEDATAQSGGSCGDSLQRRKWQWPGVEEEGSPTIAKFGTLELASTWQSQHLGCEPACSRRVFLLIKGFPEKHCACQPES